MPPHGSTSTPTDAARAWLDAHAGTAEPREEGRRASALLPALPALTDEGRRRAAEWVEARREREMAEVAAASLRCRVARAKIPERFREPRQRPLARRLLAGMPPGGCLYLWGDVGRGKTDLACSAALEWLESSPRATALFASDSDMLEDIRSAMDERGDTRARATARYVSPGLLVIDDLGKARPTEWGLEKLWSVVDGRYRAMRPTVFTSQLDRKALSAALSVASAATALPLLSRMYDGAVVHRLDGPDRRLARGL